MTAQELKTILEQHALWLNDPSKGNRADLSGADLSRADLSDANLSGAYLSGADLSGADLSDAYLSGADLSGAYLSGADLSGADLSGADLSGAYLSGAYLSRADLSGAYLSGANLSGANLSEMLAVDQLDKHILEAINGHPERLDMSKWHGSCGTTHCRAGWAVTIAGEKGKMLEAIYGPNVAAAFIYAASRPGKPVPDFYASNAAAMASIVADAADAADGTGDVKLAGSPS